MLTLASLLLLLGTFLNSLPNQNQFFSISLFLHWLNVLMFPISNGRGCSSMFSRETARASLSTFQRPQEKSVGVGCTK
jgi:hypothetical protein